MSNQHSEHGEGFNLPLKWKSSSDSMNKMLLSDPKIINLIVRSLVGTDAPPDSYSVAQTEWGNSSGEYTLYVSQNTNNKFMPLLIAIQKEVNQTTMLETIEHCTSVYDKLRLLPTVLIISIKDSSDLINDEDFSVDGDSFLMQCGSKFWAHKCLLFFPDDSIDSNRVNTPTSAFFTLCQFLSNPNKTFSLSLDLDSQSICLACKTTTNKQN